ncbi:MAG: hypothetical protein F4X80_04470 [Chloroflexi bacterium]|nr:hypothetical protein [Gammaproteobacteria bacterium]MYE31906.1 hypothetical protein [Chloroflexota bacterium]
MALAAVVLCARLAPTPATATEEPTSITTVLQPGYNLIAWLGSDASADDIFDQVPTLERISVWDGRAQDYLRRTRASIPGGGLQQLEQGGGVFLYVAGDSPFEWTREASEDSMLLDLHAGRNLVGWAGRDGTPIEDAVVRFGDALTHAWLWDAETQRYLHYRPAGPEHAHPLRELNHGDALWVELSGDARWWQSGTAPPPVEIFGYYTEREKWKIRGWVDGNRGFFAERWGVEVPTTVYAGWRDDITPVYQQVVGRSGRLPGCGYYWGPKMAIFLENYCVDGATHAHEYFHAIQLDLIGRLDRSAPAWIVEGSATYVQLMYWGTPHFRMLNPHYPSPPPSVEAQIDRYRRDIGSIGYGYWPSLSETEGGPDVTGPFPGDVYYRLGSLGIAWLAAQVGDLAVLEFFRHLSDKPDWRDAFEAAFGMTSDEFHERFDAYRTETARPLPHRSDGLDELVIEFVGDVPEQTRAAFSAEFSQVQTLLREQFGSGATDYTVYIASSGEDAKEAHREVFGTEQDRHRCVEHSLASAVILDARCYRVDRALGVAEEHFVAARALAGGVRTERGPRWLFEGAQSYVASAYLDASGRESLESRRQREAANAQGTQWSLRDLAHPYAFDGNESQAAQSVGFLAVQLLLERAGDPSLFEYYRLVSKSRGWEDAFEAAFGITVDEFYVVFEAYRSGIASPPSASTAADDAAQNRIPLDGPLPHTTDGIDAPVLVLVGELDPITRTALREEFDILQTFFRDRLGAPPGDYTVYVGADARSLRDVFRHIVGRESTDLVYCSVPRETVVLISLQCEPDFAYHHGRIVVGDLPGAGRPGERPSKGPTWLTLGSYLYTWGLYEDAAGRSDLARLRSGRAASAAGTQRPLRDAFSAGDSTPARGLAFLAIDWLVERAGERAIFDYYRRLPDSESWEAAFEAAFSIAIDDFYEEFEAYRARVAPPN